MHLYREQDILTPGCPSVSVIGYGNLGRAVALNLRDSMVPVIVGNISDSSFESAQRDGFETDDIATAASRSEIVFLSIPDEHIAACIEEDVRPRLTPGSTVAFASGYPLVFGNLDWPADIDVVLVAPRMMGYKVRDLYLEGSGAFAYVGVDTDQSGHAEERALRLALAMGCLRQGALRVSARDEALVDLLVEQAFGPMMGMALQATFEAGVQLGLEPELLVSELYMSGEMAETFRTFALVGFFRSLLSHGYTAPFGGYIRSLDIDVADMSRRFRLIGEDILNGGFASRLDEDKAQGRPVAEVLELLVTGDDPISQAEDRLRSARVTRSG